jgi:hypothetical protein
MEYASINTVYQNTKRQAAKQEQGFISPADYNYYAPLAQQQEAESLMAKYKLYLANKYRYLEYNRDNFEGIEQIADNLRPLEVIDAPISKSGSVYPLPSNYMHFIDFNLGGNPITLLQGERYRFYGRSADSTITSTFPVGVLNQKDIKILPDSITDDISLTYYKQPQGVTTTGNKTSSQPKWAYQTVNGEAVFDATNSINFELPKHLEPRLVQRILTMAATETRDSALFQMNEAEQQQNKQENL